MRKSALAIVVALLCAAFCQAQSDKPLLLRQPTLSKTQIAFVYGGDIWTVNRDGGEATRLTSGHRLKIEPEFFAGWDANRFFRENTKAAQMSM